MRAQQVSVSVSGVQRSIMIICTAFNMHQGIFLIRREFGGGANASSRMATALGRGALLCAVLYTAVGAAAALLSDDPDRVGNLLVRVCLSSLATIHGDNPQDLM